MHGLRRILLTVLGLFVAACNGRGDDDASCTMVADLKVCPGGGSTVESVCEGEVDPQSLTKEKCLTLCEGALEASGPAESCTYNGVDEALNAYVLHCAYSIGCE